MTTEDRAKRLEKMTFAATARCPCGAGLAYDDTCTMPPHRYPSYWDCSAILLGDAVPSGQPGSVQHTDRLPFAFWSVKSERQPSAHGATTRPDGARPVVAAMTGSSAQDLAEYAAGGGITLSRFHGDPAGLDATPRAAAGGRLRRFLARLRVVFRAAPTYLVGLSILVTQLAPEIARLLPEQAESIGVWSARVLAWIGGAVLIIRRVTPVIDRAERGLIPKEQ